MEIVKCNDMREAYKHKWSLHKNLSSDTKKGKQDKQVSLEGKWGWEQIIMQDYDEQWHDEKTMQSI